MRILVLGAGKIGSCIARMLGAAGNEVFVTDPNFEKNGGHQSEIGSAKIISYNIFDCPLHYMNNLDYCINAAPVYDPAAVGRLVQACIDSGTHYLDISEDVEVGEVVRKLGSEQNKILVAPHCGLAPGLISIIAGDLMKSFETLSVVDMRVGALPKAVANPFRYTCNWSHDGLVNEYLNDAQAVVDGKQKTVNAFLKDEDKGYLDPVVVDGIEYESFPTSGGIGTLIDTIFEKDHCADFDVMYRTIRYKGHFEAILPNLLRPHNSRKAIVKSLEPHLTASGDDVVVIFVRVGGLNKNGGRSSRVFAKHISSLDKLNVFTPITAIQRTTAGSVCSVLDIHAENNLMVDGKPFKTGYLRQEWIDLAAFNESRYKNLVGLI